ncbi:MAG: hypothetical protein NTZ17_07815 [Phycisphaerae bacterium]|nr:hypothetical protein [Phycisphaerae bacterium]
MPIYPFEVSYEEILRNPDQYVEAVFSCLESEFLNMPKGEGFITYPVFERGYEALKASTQSFSHMEVGSVLPTIVKEPISLVVLRTMLGFTPPEWGYLASQRACLEIPQGFTRSLDRRVRIAPEKPMNASGLMGKRLEAMVATACELLKRGAPNVPDNQIHRLDKADTRTGTRSMENVAGLGVPYAMLLYERFLGRPFAGHRDSVSELVGDSLESAVEDVLTRAGVSYRKTKRAERIEGFDQTPDFIIPSEFNPSVIIEAKITEDDGTARDKVTRILRLCSLSLEGSTTGEPKYEVVACIGGRGFGVRCEDMKRLIIHTRGKIFTTKTLNRLVDNTRLREFRTKSQ